jgi:hypothetical protein
VHPSALPVRTDRPVEIGEASFQELMAERLRQAPWLILSAAAHAVVLLMLWILIPPDAQHAIEHKVAVTDSETIEVLPPPPPLPPETRKEEVEDVRVIDPLPVEVRAENPSETVSDTPFVESAFLSNGTNTAVGVGGNAGGPYGGRPGRCGGPSRPGPGPAALDAALEWLRRHQDEDGKWDCDQFMKHDDAGKPACDGPGNAVHDVGVTGLALLAFLGDGHTLRSGSYRETVRKAVMWLRAQQQPNGLFGTPVSHDFVYDHAIAAYAMCEAYGLSGYITLRECAQGGINYLEAHRNPYGVWRYQPRDNDNDTSVTGWCIMAYSTARHFGLQVNTSALQLAAAWLDQVSEPNGTHGYTKAGEPSSRKPGDHATRFPVDRGAAMTAVGLFSRFFLGQDANEKPLLKAAADRLLEKPPVWDTKSGAIDHYYWYYASYALFQMGGTRWTTWQKKLEPVLLKNQHRDVANMNLHGSWDPACVWGEDGGRVYSTAILALCLQANYRYTRLVH